MMFAKSRRESAAAPTRSFLVGLSCFALLSPLSAVCQSQENSPPVHHRDDYATKYREVQRAILVFKQGKHTAARELLDEARLKHSELPPADVMMARLYLSAGEIRKAESALEEVVVKFPEDGEAFILLGDLALRAERFAFAELAYARAEELLHRDDANAERQRNLQIRVIAGLASLSESRGQRSQAASLLESWLEMDPSSLLAHGSLGRVLFHSGEYDRARAAFTKLVELSSNAPPVEIAMGRLYSENGMYDEALAEMSAASQRYTTDSRVLLTVGEWAINNGLTEMAERAVTDAIKLDGDSTEAQVLLARLARFRGDQVAAEAILSKLLPLQPNSILLADELARTLAVSDDPQKRKAALQHAERNYRALRRRKNSSLTLQAIVTYGWVLLHNDRAEQAEAVVRSLPSGSSISNENGFYVASVYAGRAKTDVAIKMLQSLLTENRPFPSRREAEDLLAELTNS